MGEKKRLRAPPVRCRWRSSVTAQTQTCGRASGTSPLSRSVEGTLSCCAIEPPHLVVVVRWSWGGGVLYAMCVCVCVCVCVLGAVMHYCLVSHRNKTSHRVKDYRANMQARQGQVGSHSAMQKCLVV